MSHTCRDQGQRRSQQGQPSAKGQDGKIKKPAILGRRPCLARTPPTLMVLSEEPLKSRSPME